MEKPHFESQLITELENQLQKAIKALTEVKKHGCCVMHNNEGCPGCAAIKALDDLQSPQTVRSNLRRIK